MNEISVEQPTTTRFGKAAPLFDQFVREHLEYLKPHEAPDYCGHPGREKPYYCIRPSHASGRHRYGVVFTVGVIELPAR